MATSDDDRLEQTEKTLDSCVRTLNDSKQLNTLCKRQVAEQKTIMEEQSKQIETGQIELEHAKSSGTGKTILFTILGIVVGLVLHIPLALIH